MTHVISEEKAFEIVQEFLTDILQISPDVLALYVIGSLGGGYYRPGQSDIDTAVIVRDNAAVTQEEVDQIAESYQEKYHVPKGFGAILIRSSELLPPYTKSETDEFEFTVEIARLKVQGKPVYGSLKLDDIKMPDRSDFIKDACIMENWFHREFGYPMFDKLQVADCVNSILGILRRYLMIEKHIFAFNKFKTIEIYLQNDPPLVNQQAFELIHRILHNETTGNETDLQLLQACGIEFRDFFNQTLLGIDSRKL